MSSMSNLDLMIKEASANEQQYEEFKALVDKHFVGSIHAYDLPEVLKQVLFNWELGEMELESWGCEPWEDEHDG